MGDDASALPLFRQAAEVFRAALGEGHPDYAKSLNNLATLCVAMGEHDAAELLYGRAAEVFRAALGEGHPDYATSLKSVAGVYGNAGELASALPPRARRWRSTAPRWTRTTRTLPTA